MNLKNVSNTNLLSKTHDLVQDERRITVELIEHLREIEARMLYAEVGYSSLFEFCVRHLGLSEGSAYRRISALRLIKEVPEVRDQIEAGTFSLSNAARVQAVFRTEKKNGKKRSPAEKKVIIDRVQGLSKKECELTLMQLAPEATLSSGEQFEKLRLLTPEKTELKMVLDKVTLEKADRLRDHLSHVMPYGNYADLFERLVDEKLRAMEKKLGLVG